MPEYISTTTKAKQARKQTNKHKPQETMATVYTRKLQWASVTSPLVSDIGKLCGSGPHFSDTLLTNTQICLDFSALAVNFHHVLSHLLSWSD